MAQVYTCNAPRYQAVFPGWFVFEADFPDGENGQVTLNLYQHNITGPSIMNCTFQCTKSYSGSQLFTCPVSQCCTQGWATQPIQALMNMVNKTTHISIDDTGVGQMHQECMPIAIDFQCTASACEFLNQTIPPLTLGEKIGFGIAGGVVGVALAAAVVLCFFRAHLLRQRFTSFGRRTVPLTLEWRGLSCDIPVKGGAVHALRGARGVATPGTVTALLGESGSGKVRFVCFLFCMLLSVFSKDYMSGHFGAAQDGGQSEWGGARQRAAARRRRLDARDGVRDAGRRV